MSNTYSLCQDDPWAVSLLPSMLSAEDLGYSTEKLKQSEQSHSTCSHLCCALSSPVTSDTSTIHLNTRWLSVCDIQVSLSTKITPGHVFFYPYCTRVCVYVWGGWCGVGVWVWEVSVGVWVLRIKLRVLYMLSKHSTTKLYTQSFVFGPEPHCEAQVSTDLLILLSQQLPQRC